MANLFLLNNNEVLDLFEIKINDYEGYLRFHGSKNFNSNIIFQNVEYLYIPCELSNLEYSTDGKANRPTITISNINNFITNFIKDRNDLIGKRFYRKKILAKDLDSVNFGGENKNLLGTASFSSFISNDSYVVQKKNFETKEKVEFVLSNILDIENLTVPNRKVYNNACGWTYRGCGCNYGKINGYQGPTIVQMAPFPKTFAQVNSDLGLTSNLRILLRPEGITTSGTVSVPTEARQDITLIFEKVTNWSNEGTASSTVSPAITNSPKVYKNSGRMNDKNGVLFSANKTNPIGDFDRISISDSFETKDCTIFYVSEMVSKLLNKTDRCQNGGLQRRGLTDNNYINFLLGYHGGLFDVMHSSQWLIRNANLKTCNNLNKSIIYGAVLPQTSTVLTKFIKNGVVVTEKTGFINQPTNLGINTYVGEESEMVVYELIVYDKILDDNQIKVISAFLADKYNLSIPYDIQFTDTFLGSSFFEGSNEGNLGVPMADENDKIFIGSTAANSAYSNFQSYEINKLVYRGDYSRKNNYAFGDFVKIEPSIDYDFNEKFLIKNNEIPARFFVCVAANGTTDQHPFYNTTVWKEDKCSKTLNGCSLRFNGENVGLPFGSFPGTLPYEYKLPST